MTPEIEQFLDQAQFCQRDIRKLAEILPADDDLVNSWIAHAVAERNSHYFQCLMAAGLHGGRKIHGGHLAEGAGMVPGTHALGSMAWKLEGDVDKYLMQAVSSKRLTPQIESLVLFVTAGWCVAKRNGQFPEGLISAARLLARSQLLHESCLTSLMGVAVLANDDQLRAVIQERGGSTPANQVKYTLAAYLPICEAPILEAVPDIQGKVIVQGFTMRRTVEKVGRNEPCPCGSGKKYKQCCINKDVEKLQNASFVPGKTAAEVHANREHYLTEERLRRTDVHELAGYDATKIPPGMVRSYFVKLAGLGYFDEALDKLEKLPRNEEWKECYNNTRLLALRAERADIIARMIQMKPDVTSLEDQGTLLSEKLLVAQHDPAQFLEILNDAAEEALLFDDVAGLWLLSTGMLMSPSARALGIFVARNLIPVAERDEAAQALDSILEARDKLGLPADDLFGDVLDKRFTERTWDSHYEDIKLEVAQERLEKKAEEVRHLKESLAEVTRQLGLREKKAASSAVALPAESVDERTLEELRRKVDGLKSALKARHNERNQLRRELQKTQEDLQDLQTKANATSPATQAEVDEEESLFVSVEENVQQPIRLIEFPKKFDETLNGFPRNVARATMVMIGRLAAGEPAAFVGMVKLKACPDLLRQRIGSDYRLLFRLTEHHVQIVDLINRKDLFKRLKTLGSNPWYKLFQ